ncbi:MAG: GNAT family N-acetyltransferase [Caldisericales bacterium]|nr:GNAT family N-acetyltransferase [Caldisericales bacterium]
MPEIAKLEKFSEDDLNSVLVGYTSSRKYTVEKMETNNQIVFKLDLVPLGELYIKRWFLTSEVDHYRRIVPTGYSIGAYADGEIVGMAIAENLDWNRSLFIWEFHVKEGHRRQGIGALMMNELEKEARQANLRIMVCEAQNTNADAIDFYKYCGYSIEGIDLHYYDDLDSRNEFAIYMKKIIGD